jgi:hypothetical protein
MNNTIIVPEEDRTLVIAEEDRVVEVPAEWRVLEVPNDTWRCQMILGSKIHTAGDTKRWRIDYSNWLDNTVNIADADITSSSVTCTVADIVVLGDEVIFFLTGGIQGENLTIAMTMTDTDGNIKHDTIAFTVVAP